MANYVNLARRMRLPALYFQLYDHIPTMARYQNSIISIGVQPHQRPWAGRLPASSSLFEECKLVSGDSEAIRKISDKYIVPEKLVAEYAEHLAQIKMCKEKKKEETERERMERLKTGLDCTTPISCRPWGWTSYPCTGRERPLRWLGQDSFFDIIFWHLYKVI